MSLNLNYKPEAVVDISGLSREEWLDYRKKGIGGSDAAAIMGVSPFATKRDLFYDKTGKEMAESTALSFFANAVLICESAFFWGSVRSSGSAG